MKNILKVFIFICLLIIAAPAIQGQYFEMPKQKSRGIRDKLYFGGGLGMQFGEVTYIEVAPIVAYKWTPRLHTGIGLTYSYSNDKRYTVPMEYSIYGSSIFMKFFLFEGLYAHTEAEFLNIEVYNLTSATTYVTDRQWIGNYLVGGGYFQKLGERGGIYFSVLWNLNQTDLTPYANPVMRIGFSF